MAKTNDRFMMLFIFFDLPTKTKKERKAYSDFRKFLKQSGFIMLQYSVYVRICKGQANIDTNVKRVKSALPSVGHVRSLQVTDNQYYRMEILLGTQKEEEKNGTVQLALL